MSTVLPIGPTGPTRLGSVSVSVESESHYFGYAVPIEIRDASMQLIKRGPFRSLDLPAGLYQVSAVLEDGREHSRLVQVRGGANTVVRFGTRRPASTGPVSKVDTAALPTAGSAMTFAKSSVLQQRSMRFTERADAEDGPAAAEEAGTTPASLVDVQGAHLKRQTSTLWIFECAPMVTAVSTATMQVGKRRWSISLPTSPSMGAPNLCAVRVDPAPSGAHVTAWVSSERTVANALQNMLASGQLASAATMADEATRLLRDKYEDPTGATLGALILRRVGRLSRYESWMENLARDFAWIPDGKILLASLLFERRSDLDRAHGLALQAAKQRILYTESYSILLDLLRRWPREADRSGHADAMARLAAHSPYIDWNSTCFSRSVEG